MEYGKRLNPEHSLRTPKGIKGTRQKVIVTHNPSEIDQAQEMLVRFPNNKKRSHTQLDSRKQVIAFQDRVITINIKEAQHPLK